MFRKKLFICASLWVSTTWMACDGGGPQSPDAPPPLVTEPQALQCNLGSMSLSTVPALQRLSSSACGTQLGFSVSAGDADGDVKSDVVVGAPGGATGSVCLIRGNNLLDIRNVSNKIFGDSASRLGSAVLLGNFNSTARSELLAGSTGYSLNRGAVFAVDGEKLLDSSPPVFRYVGAANSDETGTSLATGELTGDGKSDLVVGAPLSEYNTGTPSPPSNSGMVYVVKNTGAPIAATNLYASTPNIFRIQNQPQVIAQTDLRAGTSVAVLDVNGDAQEDLVVGVPGFDNGPSYVDAGAVFIFHGPLTGHRSLASADIRLVGTVAGGLAGTSLARVKNLDGSGKDGLLVGAPGAGAMHAGRAYLIPSGMLPGTVNLSNHKILEGQQGDAAGTAVASGDFDGDGKPDLLIGAPKAEGRKGAVILVYGNQTLMPINDLSAFTRFEGELAGDEAGRSVASAGDFDGDGVSDILVGAPGYSSAQGIVYLIRGQGPRDWYPDRDGDGHGDKNALAERDCVSPAPGQWVRNNDDCNDGNAQINPGLPELCATVGVDDNCDGEVDDSTASDAIIWCRDADNDLHGDVFTPLQQACVKPGNDWIRNEDQLGYECFSPDADKDPGTNEHALESCDSRDNNCNGEIDEGDNTIWYVDVDGDGFGSDVEFFPYHAGCASIPRPRYVSNKLDCNDRDSSLNPNTPWYLDKDGDGVGSSSEPVVRSCVKPPGSYVRSGNDCNDNDPAVRPDIAEVCEAENLPQVDNNCNGTPDDTFDAPTWFEDKDGDDYGGPVQLGRFCGRPPKSSKRTGDCNDEQPKSFPGNLEVCEVDPGGNPYTYVEQIDNNCKDGVDDTTEARWWSGDGDQDGFRGTAFGLSRCTNPSGDNKVKGKYLLDDALLDCNDADSGATSVKMWYPDTDGDNCGNPNQGISSCYNPNPVCGQGVTYVTVTGPNCK